MTERKIATLALLGYAILGGFVFPLTKPALQNISAFNYMYMRYLFAAVFFLPVVIWFFIKNPPKLSILWKIFLLEAFVAPAGLIVLYLGLAKTTALESSLITMMAPIFTTFGGIYFLYEKQEKHEWLGLALAFFGSAMLVFEPLLAGGLGNVKFSLEGNLFLLGYNILVTLYFLAAKKIYKDTSKIFASGMNVVFGLPIYFIMDKITGASVPGMLLNPQTLVAVVYITFYTVAAAPLYLYGQGKIEASEASVFVYLSGVIGAPLSVLILHEKMSLFAGLCLIAIVLGVVIAEARRKRGKKEGYII
jgi:drug/metabolite transporter (DMT)-like permease